MLLHANDNRSPADHRAIVDSNPKSNPRPHKTRWPQAERLQRDIGGKYMIEAMMDWRRREALPVLCVANDNWRDDLDEEAGEEQEYRFDNRLDHDTADRTVALHEAGKAWQPGEERFTRSHRNDRAKAPPPAGSYRYNGLDLPQLEANAEDEIHRVIDQRALRQKLGPICRRLLDLASSDSTTEEITKAMKQHDPARMQTYIDWSIIKFMREAA